jgi:hypothetical protein
MALLENDFALMGAIRVISLMELVEPMLSQRQSRGEVIGLLSLLGV